MKKIVAANTESTGGGHGKAGKVCPYCKGKDTDVVIGRNQEPTVEYYCNNCDEVFESDEKPVKAATSISKGMETFLEDVAQVQGKFNYTDIYKFARSVTPEQLEALKKLRKSYIRYGTNEDETKMEEVAERIKNLILQPKTVTSTTKPATKYFVKEEDTSYKWNGDQGYAKKVWRYEVFNPYGDGDGYAEVAELDGVYWFEDIEDAFNAPMGSLKKCIDASSGSEYTLKEIESKINSAFRKYVNDYLRNKMDENGEFESDAVMSGSDVDVDVTIQDKIPDLSAAYKTFEDKGFKKVYGFSERNEYYCRYYAKLNKDQTVDMACVSLYTDNADQVKLDIATGNNLDLEDVEEFVIDQGDSKDFFDNAIKPYLPVKDDRDEETIFNDKYQKSVEGLMGDYYSLKDQTSIDLATRDRIKRAYKKYKDLKHEGEVNHAQILDQISVKPFVIKWLKAILTQD